MRVHVDGDIHISGDRYGFTVERKRIIKGGKTAGQEIYEPLGYYVTLKDAIMSVIKYRLSESTARTLKELLEEHKRIAREIEEAVLI